MKSTSADLLIAFGTVIRNAPVTEAGELVILDWSKKLVLRHTPIYPQNPRMDHDPNPRGNTRGCKGITIAKDRMFVADFHSVHVFDMALNELGVISHGLMVGLHETFSASGNSLWAASTAIDAALEYDLSTGRLLNSFWPREIESFQRALNLVPLDIDKNADNRRRFMTDEHVKAHSHLHLNAITEHDGAIYALFHAHGAICNLTSGEVLIRDQALVKGHNLLLLEDNIVACNDTFGQTVRTYDLVKRQLVNVIDLKQFSWIKQLRKAANHVNFPRRILKGIGFTRESISRPLFTRGLDRHMDHLFVGLSPASIVCVNWRTGTLVDAFQYDRDPRACVHGLAVFQY